MQKPHVSQNTLSPYNWIHVDINSSSSLLLLTEEIMKIVADRIHVHLKKENYVCPIEKLTLKKSTILLG